MPHYTYILLCEGGHYYTGTTTDPHRRLLQHRGALPGGAKSTRALRPICFAAIWRAETKGAALSLEARIKRLSHLQKQALVCGGSLPPVPGHSFERLKLNADKTGLAEADDIFMQ